MNDLVKYAQPVGVIGLVLICFYVVKMLNGKLKNKVNKELCEERSGNIEKKLDEIQEDVKELLKR